MADDRDIEAERYRVLWHRARDIVLFIGEEGRILDANDAAVDAYGWSREELRAMHIHQLRAPETRGAVPPQIQAAFERGLLFETVHVRRDGARIPVEVSSRPTVVGGERFLVSVIRDVSERHAMQARLAQADRLASVGTLAAGVAHEINNPLAFAITGIEVALREVRAAQQGAPASTTRLAELLQTALHGTERVRAIVRDLKMLARDDEERTAVDVRAVIDSCLELAQHELRRVRLVRTYGEVPPISANEGRLAQVFLNLIVNAAHACAARDDGGGTLRIETELRGRDGVIVRVADDGVGIAPEILPRIFDAFVTTKRAGEGTGLGLYLSRSLVNELGGTIEVESAPGRGATFTVALPRGTPSSQPPRGIAPSPSRRVRMLVVDDEIAIGRTLTAALEGEHDLVVVTSGESALEVLARDDRFDVILTDLSMHGISGLELIREIGARHPALARRVLLMTAGAPPPDMDADRVLEKPFAVETLRERVAGVVAPREE